MAPENPLAIVPYQPPVIHHHQIFIVMARIVAGPLVPPKMIWKRSFDNLMSDFTTREVPRPICFKPLGKVIYSKRTWSIAFDDTRKMPLLVAMLPCSIPEKIIVLARRPVARALFDTVTDESLDTSVDFLQERVNEMPWSSSVIFSAEKQSKGKKTG